MRTYTQHQSPFYKCSTKRKLAQILKVDLRDLKKIVREIREEKAYDSYVRKGRDITEPHLELKKVQKRIKQLLSRIEIPGWVHGGIKKRSTKTNALEHKDSEFFLTIDIKSFFGNCSRERVYQYFKYRMDMSPDVSAIMTDLTTYSSSIVTGGPASVHLSFHVYKEMFYEIYQLASKSNLVMTLYIDDVSFSGPYKVEDLNLFLERLKRILRRYGHRLNLDKTSCKSKSEFPKITGIIIDRSREIKVPNKLRYRIVRDLREKKSLTNSKQILKIEKSIVGRILSAQQIEKDVFRNTLANLK